MKEETSVIMEKYKDNVFSAAFNVCGNAADAEDVVQETFLQYHITNNDFFDEQHIRAWLLRVAINKAKNITLSFRRRKCIPLEEYMESLTFDTPELQTLFEEVMKLPEKYRIVIHLYYYEGYSTAETAKIIGISETSVQTRLYRGRNLLKKSLGEDVCV